MKTITLGILAFLTFMPSFVCMMAVCPMSSAQASEVMPCHQQSDDGRKSVKDIMLAQDCMGVDFFQQDVSADFSPDMALTDIVFFWADLSIYDGFAPLMQQDIRGPPRLPDIVSNAPPVYLSTLRIRI
jgi:hypothetical protein